VKKRNGPIIRALFVVLGMVSFGLGVLGIFFALAANHALSIAQRLPVCSQFQQALPMAD